MMAKGEMDEAESLFRQAIKCNPNHAESLANMGWMLLKSEKYEESAEFTERAIKSSKSLASAYNNLGLCQYEMTEGMEAALKNFKTCLELNSEFKGVRYSMGHAYLKQGNMDAALREWRLAVQKERDNADAHLNIGVVLYKKKDFEQSVRSFEKVVNIRRDVALDYSNLGLAHARIGNHDKAIDYFDKAIKLDPKNPMLHSNRGLACFFAKRAEDAMKEWMIVSKLNPAYYRSRGAKQQSEYDESALDFAPLDVSSRAQHIQPGTGSFMYAPLPGYEFCKWEMEYSDLNLQELAKLKGQHDEIERSLRAWSA
jgi:superkiller protein 3